MWVSRGCVPQWSLISAQLISPQLQGRPSRALCCLGDRTLTASAITFKPEGGVSYSSSSHIVHQHQSRALGTHLRAGVVAPKDDDIV